MLRPPRYIFLAVCLLIAFVSHGQLTIRGTVVDKDRINYVENVLVKSSSGAVTSTDSLGRYVISAGINDSLTFFYNNKPTQQFAVKTIQDLDKFDISIRLNIKGKYRVLDEVRVYSKSHRQDSIENRETYGDIFDYHRPGLSTSIAPGGGVGADINELINIFRFRRNRALRNFQERLELQEQEKYIDYRFNKLNVKRTTGLSGNMLDTFLVWYRPSYEFARYSDELTFTQYILDASYQFQKLYIAPGTLRKEE